MPEIQIFCLARPCRLVNVYRRFEKPQCCHFQGQSAPKYSGTGTQARLPVPEGEGTTILPAPEGEGTTILPAPEGEGTTILPVPEGEGTTILPVPEGEGTTILPAPEGEGTTILPAPEGEGTTTPSRRNTTEEMNLRGLHCHVVWTGLSWLRVESKGVLK